MLNVQSGTCLWVSGHVGGQSLYLEEEPPLLVSRGEEIRICLECHRTLARGDRHPASMRL